MSEKVVETLNTDSAGFEIHEDGESHGFVAWGKDAKELKKVKKVLEKFIKNQEKKGR